jgi:hypothetical protein
MHRRKPSTLLLALVVLAGFAADLRAEELKIGLVLGQDSRNDELEAKALNAATEAFLLSRRFQVVEREALDSVFTEKGLKGFIGDAEGADIGQTLGLDWIGILTYAADPVEDPDGGYSYHYLLSVRMLDVASGAVLHTIDSRPESAKAARGLRSIGERVVGRKLDYETRRDLGDVETVVVTDTMEDAGARLLQNVLETFPPQGYVIERVGKREVVIDLGAAQGLREGDTLEVFTHGPPIIHPVTGQEIPGREITQAQLKVTSVESQISTCKVKKADGPVDVGAEVRFVPKEGLVGRALDKLPFGG